MRKALTMPTAAIVAPDDTPACPASLRICKVGDSLSQLRLTEARADPKYEYLPNVIGRIAYVEKRAVSLGL